MAALSLSARRAWIEITRKLKKLRQRMVALRKESVDRNTHAINCRSESVDRNSYITNKYPVIRTVALRKESVDRNEGACYNKGGLMSRSPQGERG